MSVSVILIVIMAVLFACGVYAMLERSLTRVLIGFLLLGNGANLLLLSVMGAPGIAPFRDGEAGDQRTSDPLPMALTLTAIVIGACDIALAFAFIMKLHRFERSVNVDDFRRLKG